MANKTDEQLVKLTRKKNITAFKELYCRYEMSIYNFIYRYTGSREIAQELIQETFSRVWFSLRRFDAQKGSFKSWLYTVALNVTRNEMVKKEYTYHFTPVEEGLDREWAGTDQQDFNPETVTVEKELKETLVQAIGGLPVKLREVVVMKNYQYLTFKEIAEITETPESTIKSRYVKAIEELKRSAIFAKEVNGHV